MLTPPPSLGKQSPPPQQARKRE